MHTVSITIPQGARELRGGHETTLLISLNNNLKKKKRSLIVFYHAHISSHNSIVYLPIVKACNKKTILLSSIL